MKNNTKIFIEKLFLEPNEEFIKLLLNDFSDGMNTKMRENDKYVILILLDNTLILAHSKIGEKSINTNFNVFERLLDKDNVMRVVFFEKKEDKINVSHFEKNKSKFFIEWLGLPQRDLFYSFGGENKFYSEIQGYSIVLEISDEDLDTIHNNEFISIEDEKIKFSTNIDHLKIQHIMRQNKKYKNFNSFKNDFLSRKYDLMSYKEEYEKLKNSLIPTIEKVFDCESEVKSRTYHLEKINENIKILFCNELIDIDEDYLNKIYSSILNDEPLKIVHMGEKINQTPITIGNLKIYNELKRDFTKHLIKFLNENNHSSSFRKELIFVILDCLKYENSDSEMVFFIEDLSKKFIKEFDFNSILTENSILELKTKEYFLGRNEEILEKLHKDMIKKLNKNNFKLYLIGYDEKTRQYDPFLSRPFNYDRIEYLEKELKNKLKISYLKITKIPFNEINCIIMISVKK